MAYVVIILAAVGEGDKLGGEEVWRSNNANRRTVEEVAFRSRNSAQVPRVDESQNSGVGEAATTEYGADLGLVVDTGCDFHYYIHG